MNKHILLVMRWLNDKDSATWKELEENKHGSYAANTAVEAATYAACAAAAHHGWSDTAYQTGTASAAYWVDVYFDRTGEDKEDYLKELEK